MLVCVPGGEMRGDMENGTQLIDRRRALQVIGGIGLLAVGACGSSGSSSDQTATDSNSFSATTTSTTDTQATQAAASCALIPEETAGPFPGDGSNGPNVLNQSGVVRSDITSSFGTSSTK